MAKDIKSYRYKELDALRGIAALMVVFFHFTMGRTEAKFGFKLGTTGVDLFFIISGFVIYMSLSNARNSVDFIINRVSRLYPTYWTCVTFTFILISVNTNGGLGSIDLISYLGNMTMFQFYLKIENLDGSYWTMIIEMIFYMGILFLFYFKMLKYLNVIGISLSVLVVMLTSFWGDVSLVKKIIDWIPLLQFIPLFFAGTIFYKIHIYKTKLVENYSILIICLINQILLFNYSKSSTFINQSEYAIMLIIYFALFILFVNEKLNFIVSRGTLFLGKISFTLYLIHQYVSNGFIIPFLTQVLNINFWIASIFVTLPIIISLATFITYYIEIPLSKRMKKKLRTTATLQ